MFRFKYLFKDGTHLFTPYRVKFLGDACNSAQYLMSINDAIKQIDIYENDKLIASIYG